MSDLLIAVGMLCVVAAVLLLAGFAWALLAVGVVLVWTGGVQAVNRQPADKSKAAR